MIEPLLHRILVKPEKFEEFSEEHRRIKELGWALPTTDEMKRAEASVDRGVVVALGATAYRDFNTDPPVKVGDIVNYARFAGKLLKDPADGDSYVILNDEDLICVIKEI